MRILITQRAISSSCSHGDVEADYGDAVDSTHGGYVSLEGKPKHTDDDYCKPNTSYVWCLPRDYNQEKHPFTCK